MTVKNPSQKREHKDKSNLSQTLLESELTTYSEYSSIAFLSQVLLEEFSRVFGMREEGKGETQHELQTDSQLS